MEIEDMTTVVATTMIAAAGMTTTKTAGITIEASQIGAPMTDGIRGTNCFT
ncbi:hypothetical protein [Comamonas sp. 26]|uniref:hypothetical protein n=1 Tax=Comamonas sp. 26 TaxID=2035201 RepID=UPI00130473EC|nr:hypothetical protein [Comamonas sp. 26]